MSCIIPHDGDRESLWLEGGTKGVMSSLGFHPTVVERPRNKLEAIAAARAAFARCQFDEQGCDLGLQRLRAYRKEGDMYPSNRPTRARKRIAARSLAAERLVVAAEGVRQLRKRIHLMSWPSGSDRHHL